MVVANPTDVVVPLPTVAAPQAVAVFVAVLPSAVVVFVPQTAVVASVVLLRR